MSQGAESTPPSPQRRLTKKYAIAGGFAFAAGLLSALVSWVLYREVWFTSGVLAIIGAFLLTFSLISRSTKMG